MTGCDAPPLLLSEALPESPSGLQLVRLGAYSGQLDVWTAGWVVNASKQPLHVLRTGPWNSTLILGVNNRNFPVLSLRPSTAGGMSTEDAEALLTGSEHAVMILPDDGGEGSATLNILTLNIFDS